MILRDHNYSGQENEVVPTGTGTLELPFEEMEEILRNNAPSLTMVSIVKTYFHNLFSYIFLMLNSARNV